MDTQYTEPVGDIQQYDPDYHRVANFIGLDHNDRQDAKTAKKVTALREWAKEKTNAGTLDEELRTLNDFRRSVGTQLQGKSLIDQLYQQIRIQSMPKTNKQARAIKREEAKKRVTAPKTGSIEKVIEQSVNERIGAIIAKTMTNKNIIYKAVNQAVAKAFK